MLMETKPSKRERERLRAVDKEMRVALSAVSSRIGLLCSRKQAQMLHWNSKKDMECLAF
jgi:hypothetical protein